jgi:hypothetical protein
MSTGAEEAVERFNKRMNSKRSTTCQIVSTLVFSTISIASLAIGVIGKDDCPIKPQIPLWLIVNGAYGIAIGAFMILAVR